MDIVEFMKYHPGDISKTLHDSVDHEVLLNFTLYMDLENADDYQSENGHINARGFTIKTKSLIDTYILDLEKDLKFKLETLKSHGEFILKRITRLGIRVYIHIPRL